MRAPWGLTARIALAFVAVALTTLLAVGGGLFVALRTLHAEATRASLADLTQPLVAQIRAATGDRDLRKLVNELRPQVARLGAEVHFITAAGAVIDFGDGAALPVDLVVIPSDAKRGTILTGELRSPDGDTHLYALTVLRGPLAAGPRALVLTVPDASGRDALRDLTRTLPFVILLAVVAGIPIAWLLSRSVTRPLRRLTEATADVSAAVPPALPLEGPAEVRELTSRFNAMAAELADNRRRERELLANLRHDLRTPVTVVSGFAQALADGTASGDDATRAARAIGEEAARLERLVDELGAVERLRSGGGGLRPESLDAGEVIAAAVDRFGPSAVTSGVAVEPAVPTGVPAGLTFAADRLAVERIVANLVANALAAAPSPGGHVWLDAQRAIAADGRAAVALSVTDDGPGFPAGAGERVFERFYRADPSRSGANSGLGLAIVRELAEAHGGTAHAENVAPRGARVSVVFPEVPRPARMDG